MLLLALALVACAPHPAPPAPPVAEVDATVSPPVTLEQFRAAFPAGTTIRLRIATKGQPTVVQKWVWTQVDEAGCTIASSVYDEKGELLKDEGESRTTWAELMGHATFPAAKTTKTDGAIGVPAGTFATWVYTVQAAAEDGTPQVKTYHFAQTMPGPPVLFTIQQGGEEIFRMTMIERTRG